MSRPFTPCGACAYRRERCYVNCPLAPYFKNPENIQDYAAIQKIIGYKNFLRLIRRVSVADRQRTVDSIKWEALYRLHAPVLGCLSYIFFLEERIQELEEQISQSKAQPSPDLNNTIKDPEFDMDGMWDLVATTSLEDLIVSIPDSPTSSRISSTNPILAPPNGNPSSHSHWSDLVQHFKSNKFQLSLDQIEGPSIPRSPNFLPTISQTSSSETPTPATNPYYFFNVNNLAISQQNLAPLSQGPDDFIDMIREQESLELNSLREGRNSDPLVTETSWS